MALPRTALVTGASSGIGLGIAQQLLVEGYRVFASARSAEKLKGAFGPESAAALETGRLVCGGRISAPTGTEDLVKAVEAHLKGAPLHVLVNNAGVFAGGLGFGEKSFSVANLDAQFALNVRAPTLVLHFATSALARAGDASVINISSVVAVRPMATAVPYSMTKGAIETLTVGAAVELAAKGIRVNSIAPGVIATNVFAAAGMPAEAEKAFLANAAASNPLGRTGKPIDIAHAASYFADSNRSGYVTGSTLLVDGGAASRS